MTRFVYDAKQDRVVEKGERADRPFVHNIAPDWKPYKSPMGDGKVIDGRREAREHHKLHGTRILEPGETQQAMKIRERNLAELRQGIDPDAYQRMDSPGQFEVKTTRR